jgi:hypothetical protein
MANRTDTTAKTRYEILFIFLSIANASLCIFAAHYLKINELTSATARITVPLIADKARMSGIWFIGLPFFALFWVVRSLFERVI